MKKKKPTNDTNGLNFRRGLILSKPFINQESRFPEGTAKLGRLPSEHPGGDIKIKEEINYYCGFSLFICNI